MPIRRQHRWLYPIDWPQISALIRFQRARVRCEQRGRPHGRWWDDDAKSWRNGKEAIQPGRCAPSPEAKTILTTKVVLAAAHLDHDPGNNRPRT